jgi:hypothetical protein
MKKPPRPKIPKDAADNYVFMELDLDPKVVRALEDEARARNVTVDHLMWEAWATVFQKRGIPLEPELRSYLAEHAAHIPAQLRANLLKPDLH